MTTIRTLADRYGDDDEERAALEAATRRRLDRLRSQSGKRCPRCDLVKPLDAFGRDATRADGLRVYCRSCRFESGRSA